MQAATDKIKLTGYFILNILRKRAQKVKKHNNFTFHDYLPQCRS